MSVRSALTAAAFAVTANAAAAHEFTAALFVTGDAREARLAEAVSGFLLAADERDGHSAETSDGHLGGVDVQLLPLPAEAAGRVSGLLGTPRMPPDVVVVIGPGTAPAGLSADSIVMYPGTLPDNWADADGSGSFAVRYRNAYGPAPTEAAAQGYNAARRLDMAIRPLDGLMPRAAFEATLADSAGGIKWKRAGQ